MAREWDELIVGGGSCGAVLAARLAENADRRVLLLEAGPAAVKDTGDPLGAAVLTGFNWDYSAYLGSGGRQCAYGVGRVLGGSSAVNGAIALRGLPGDFDGWAAEGNPEWAWASVLPWFVKLESDAGAPGDAHGVDGPIPIRRPSPADLDDASAAFLDACRLRGIPELPDMNGGLAVGAGLVPSNARRRRRISTADAYLAPTRRPPNLTIRHGCEVSRVLLQGSRAIGAETSHGRFFSERVTLCAGGINTPVLLQRSGIGDARTLAALGISPIADLPGVGRNLIDQVGVMIWAVPRSGVGRPGAPWHQVMCRVRSGGDGSPPLSMFLASNISGQAMPMLGEVTRDRMAVAISVMLLTPESRGTVSVPSAAPIADPAITLNLVSAQSDVTRLADGIRTAWSLVRSSPMEKVLDEVFLLNDRLVEDDGRLASAIRRFATPLWHPVGTARMGTSADGTAVVDQYCRVHAIDGLRVVDASVMPSAPSAPTNLTCIMLAEKVARWMKE